MFISILSILSAFPCAMIGCGVLASNVMLGFRYDLICCFVDSEEEIDTCIHICIYVLGVESRSERGTVLYVR